jgi:hypothetical protein
MEVIWLLCVSLGSSTVQLYDSLGTRSACSDAGFSSQNDDSVTEEHSSAVRFCG